MAETPQVRLAEVVGALSLATDVGMGSPLELGLGTRCASTSATSAAPSRTGGTRSSARSSRAIRSRSRGAGAARHTGPLETPQGDVPPTGRAVQMAFALFVEGDPAAGEASRVALYMDNFAMAAQRGLIAEPQATGATA